MYIYLTLTFSPPLARGPGFFHRHTPANTCVMFITRVHPYARARTYTHTHARACQKSLQTLDLCFKVSMDVKQHLKKHHLEHHRAKDRPLQRRAARLPQC